MGFLPIFMDLTGERCVVVGGGAVAAGKVRQLLEAGAVVRVISPSLCGPLAELVQVHPAQLQHEMRSYRSGDLNGARLVFAATDDPEIQEQVYRDAEQLGVPANCVDEPERCRFIMPAVSRQGRIAVAVSTGGASPALAGRLRDFFASAMPSEYVTAAEILADLRKAVPPGPGRQAALRSLLDDGLLDALRLGDASRVEALLASFDARLYPDRPEPAVRKSWKPSSSS